MGMYILDRMLLALLALSSRVDQSISQSRWNCPLMLESCELLQGIEGLKGSKGVPGTSGPVGLPGSPGAYGPPGDPGTAYGGGTIYIKGSKGSPGPPGAKGPKGDQGPRGNPGDLGGPLGGRGLAGERGDAGSPGAPGEKGDPSVTNVNWKQCTFRLNVNQKEGVVHACTFRKLGSQTALHLTYQGDVHVGLCGTCCKKWELQINGQSCSLPGAIDAVYDNLMLVNNGRTNVLPVFWHGSISGYCSGIPGGSVRIALVLSNCSNNPSGSITVNSNVVNIGRIIIQEVQESQS